MKKAAKATFKICTKFIIGFLVVITVLGGLTAWRLSQGPVNLDIAVPYFIDYFNENNSEKVAMDSLVLKWDGWDNPLGLTAKNVVVSNDRGPFLFSPEIDLNIGLASLLLGQLDLQTVWIREIVISITKQENGNFTLTGQPSDDNNDDGEAMTPAMFTLNNLIYDLPKVDSFWLDEATIIYHDKAQHITKRLSPATLYIAIETEENQRFINGFLTLPFDENTTNNVVRLRFDTVRDPLLLNVSGTFEDTALSDFLQFAPPLPEGLTIDMTVDADMEFQLDNMFHLHALNANLIAQEGVINYPLNAETDKVALSDIKVEASLNPRDNILQIKNMAATLNEAVVMTLNGNLESINSPTDLSGDMNMTIRDLPESYFNRYWPDGHTDNGAYRWIGERIEDGIFTEIYFEAGFDLGLLDDTTSSPIPAWLHHAKGRFAYDDLTINYRPPMAKAVGTSGTGIYDLVELTLNIAESSIGDMQVNDATLYFDDMITRGKGLGDFTFPVSTDLQNVFDFIGAPPIGAFDTIDFKPENTQGRVKADVKIKLPLLKDVTIDDVDITVEGTITDAVIPDAVRGLTLSGGPYEVKASIGDIQVEGSGQLAGQPIRLKWHEYFSPQDEADFLSSIEATVTANDIIRETFADNIADYFSGPSVIELDYMTDKNGRDTSIDLALDLTDTAVTIDKIGLNKPSDVATNATLQVLLANGNMTAINALSIKGDDLSLANGTLRFRNEAGDPIVTRIDLNDFDYGDNQFTITTAEENGMLKTNIKGDYLDIRPLLKGDKQQLGDTYDETKTASRPMEIGITVNELQTSDATLKQSKLYARLNANTQIERLELDGFLGPQGRAGNLRVRYNPDSDDGLSLRVESDNAGEVLRAFDLYPKINGGTLQIAGKPKQGGRFGDVTGRARINNFEVKDAPVLVRLLNAMSLNNFLQAGTLGFTRLEADFEWQIGQGGDIYTIKNGRTSGASIALTFDGYVNTETDDMRIAGTAAPLSELNNIIGNIPLVGQLLTGGGAFLAATYTISGNPSDPDVGVNPLSVLAPGIVRKMLFESNPTPDVKDVTPDEQKQELN